MRIKTNCPCGRKKLYAQCCEMIHKDIFNAKTAEDLMRSRYTAFTLGDVDYLMASQHSSTKEEAQKEEIQNWAKSVQWMKLDVLNRTKGLENDTVGTVAFKAFFKEGGRLDEIHENSTFCKENGHWVYLGSQ